MRRTRREAFDEHIWLSLKNAKILVNHIAAKIAEADAENAQIYADNAGEYISEIDALESRYLQTINSATRKTLIFADRFPFRYLADDYELTCYAAFPGCSAETEASAKTIAFLAEKADLTEVPCLIVIDGSSTKIAETVNAESSKTGRYLS